MGHCYPDRNSERLIMDLHVKCENYESGCEWTGELRNLKIHRESCVHALVPCPNQCGEKLLRPKLSEHVANVCTKRPHTCENCGLQDTYSFITTDHYFLCPNASIMCTNEGCWATFKRSEKTDHMAMCPKEMLTCPYVTVGCGMRMRREELDSHKRDHMEQHLSMAVEKINGLDQVMHNHQRELQRLGWHSQVVLRMGKILQREITHEWWHSPHFYTSPTGYKLSISAAMVGEYLSVYLCLVRGEFDDALAWPMKGAFIISLLNQLENSSHYSVTLNYDSDVSTPSNTRVMAGRGRGYGFPHFITRAQLVCNLSDNCQYLKDNALFFSVSSMDNISVAERRWFSLPIAFLYR